MTESIKGLRRPEEEAKKEEWLGKLADFIVIANGKTWAADSPKIDPQRPGYKELQWPYPVMTEKDLEDYKGWEDWLLRDSYAGYFRAPGMTTVYYKGKPVWNMQYGGHGLTEGNEERVKEVFQFLKSALMKVSSSMPFRGPTLFQEGSLRYLFEYDGDIEDCIWKEQITEDSRRLFSQIGSAGIIIDKDSNKQPVAPWNL